MNGPATLLVVLGALYLVECIVAVPGGLVAFRGTARASWRVLAGGFGIGARGTRLHFVPLLPWQAGLLFAAEGSSNESTFDTQRVRTRFDEFRLATRVLRVDSVGMFLAVFILAPVLVRLLGWDVSWPFLFAAVAGLAMFVVGDYRRAHALLSPGTGGAPLGVLFTLALSPASAMRASDLLLRSLFTGHDALAVASVLSSPEEFERMAAARVRAWRRGEPRSPGAEALLVGVFGDLDRLAAPPPQRDPGARSYCPSCLAEYVLGSGECEGCGGVALLAFDAEGASPAEARSQ